MPDPSVIYGRPYVQKEQDTRNLSRIKTAKSRSADRVSGGGGAIPGLEDIGALQDMLGAYGNMGAPDIEGLKAELRQAIAGQFDPLIGGVTKDISGAKKRAGSAKRDIGAIYDDLVQYYEGQVAPTKARGKAAKSEAKQNAAALKSSISADYASRLKEQVDMYKNLGIESAAPSATEGQSEDLANMLAVAENTRAAEESALNIQEAGDLGYWTEGAGISKSEGAEQQAVITQQLNQYLNDQNQQLSVLKGQKKAAYHAGLMQLQQQAAEAASKQQNQLWDRMLQLARLKLSAASQAGSGGGAGRGPGRGLTGALSFLQQSGAGALGSTFQQYLAEAQRWAGTPQARAMYGGSVDSPEEWAQVIRDHAANKGLPGDERDALWQAALRYYGRG